MKLPPLSFSVPQVFVEQALNSHRAKSATSEWTFTNSRPPKGLNATPAPVDEATIIEAVIASASLLVHPDFKHFAVSFTSARGDEGIQAHITASVDPIEGGTQVAEVEQVPVKPTTAPAVAEAEVEEPADEPVSPFAQAAAQTSTATTLADVMAAESAEDDTRVPDAGSLFSAATAADEPEVEETIPAGGIFAGFTKPDNSAGE